MGLSYSKFLIIIILLSAISHPVYSNRDAPSLGRPLAPEAAHAAESAVLPDGTGLPAGSGRAADGERLFAARCVACHGPAGRGGLGGELAGGDPDLTRPSPDQTIGTYWPFATTLFDFVRRAMPMDAPWSLSDPEVYAVTAYLLVLQGLWPEERPLDAAGLTALEMPNRDGFVGEEANWGPVIPRRAAE